MRPFVMRRPTPTLNKAVNIMIKSSPPHPPSRPLTPLPPKPPPPPTLRRRIIPHHLLDPPLIRGAILLEQIIRIRLRGTLRIHLIEQHLDADQNLLDRDRGPPPLLFVENGEADGPRRVDVGVEERRDEFALWRFGRVF